MAALGRRIFLFLLTNAVLMVVMSIIMSFITSAFGIPPTYSTQIILFYGLLGFGGAFISLMMSKFMAKKSMKLKIIQPNTTDEMEKFLYQTVHKLSMKAGIKKMPEVAIYPSKEINAFATGPSKNNSLVAASIGLLEGMNRDEIEGVLAHEVAHITNGDMVTMTLLQGVINSCVMIFARVISDMVARRSGSDGGGSYALRHGLYIVLSSTLGILGSIVVASFSRFREYRADRGGAQLAGSAKMVAALSALQNLVSQPRLKQARIRTSRGQHALDTLKISGKQRGSFKQLFSTHPPLDDRIRRLKTGS